MIKAMLAVAVALTLAFGVSACGKKGPLDPPPQETEQTTSG
ncbi:MAG: lipoprotein [Pseudomonadota bacterium]